MSHLLSNPLDFPLHSSRLIEASAGTGKTYTIAALYVRLVIGHGDPDQCFPRELIPKNILVMTFTKAATEELSDRIRARLAEAASYFRQPDKISDDAFLANLRDDCEQRQQNLQHLARLLDLASQSMDEAAVKTIHGWCQAMLKEHAFASGSLFSQNVETEDDELRLQAAEDYFRHFVYSAEETVAERLLNDFGTPQQLLSLTYSLSTTSSINSSDNLAELLQQSEEGHQQRVVAIKQHLAPLINQVIAATEGVKGVATKVKHLQKFADWCADPSATDANFTAANWKCISAADFVEFADNKLGGMQEDWRPLTQFQQQLNDSMVQQQAELAKIKQHAANWVSKRFAELQNQRAEMGHDDMLTRLRDALRGPNGEQLAKTIREQYPVAMVDEFQDTDPIQYEILNRIYRLQSPPPETGIFLIGDPKQAIYSFRNADIFTYLKARRDTTGRHYNLATNFRSSADMVASVNELFARAESNHQRGAFLFQHAEQNPLPFTSVQANGLKRSFKHCLLSSGVKTAPALLWSVSDQEKRTKEQMFRTAASHHANLIASLLNDPQAGFYDDSEQLRERVSSRDIAVLVNNFNEANAIKKALSERGLKSVYLSDRESVFAQRVAKDILALVAACAEPRNPSRVRSALATQLLQLTFTQLEQLHSDEKVWEERVGEFIDYHQQWQRQGILAMLHRLLHDYQVPAKLLADKVNGERQLADVLHIAELLQQQSMVLDGIPALVSELTAAVNERHGFGAGSRTQLDQQQLRLESDDELIKIITIHKSKGLQFPLVFLPFVSYTQAEQYRVRVPSTYHDDDGELQVLWSKKDDNKRRVSDEILAEDLRKMYVALTRAQYGTFVALETMREHRNNPLFYLLNEGQSLRQPLYDEVSERWQQAPHTRVTRLEDDEPLVRALHVDDETPALQARRMPAEHSLEHWWVASYSALTYRQHSPLPASFPEPQSAKEMNLLEASDEEVENAPTKGKSEPLPMGSIHHLPKGAGPGTFLHNLLEEAAHQGFATVAEDAAACKELIERYCESDHWQPYQATLQHWLSDYLTTTIGLHNDATSIRLCDLSEYTAEPEFWFAAQRVDAEELDRLVQQEIMPGWPRPSVEAKQLNGMLKGFIDLVFEHQGCYYVADYKSNWLGSDDSAYSQEAMRDKILSSRYDLQYVIYTLALHRLLKSRLGEQYDYHQHVGGAVYLFLRGHQAKGAGAFFDQPSKTLIEQLDALFAGQSSEVL